METRKSRICLTDQILVGNLQMNVRHHAEFGIEWNNLKF